MKKPCGADWKPPSHQYFCGEEYFCHELSIDPSTLCRFRNASVKKVVNWLILQVAVQAGLTTGALKTSSLERVSIDTTVQKKTVACPTDARLFNRSRERLVRLAGKHGVRLRQNYNRPGPRILMWASRYFHARQVNRARRKVKRLKVLLDRVYRDIAWKISEKANLQAAFSAEPDLAKRLLGQQRQDRNKLYSLHTPEVECIGKGKAHKKFKFGVEVSVAVSNLDNCIVGMRAEPDNPCDGHTLAGAIAQVERITGQTIRRAFVDRGYRGHKLKAPQVLISGSKRGLTPQMKKELRRRSAIEPMIGHMKADGKLGRNHLLGTLGDKIHALLCGAGHNIRLILRKLRELLLFVCRDACRAFCRLRLALTTR